MATLSLTATTLTTAPVAVSAASPTVFPDALPVKTPDNRDGAGILPRPARTRLDLQTIRG